ncbi:MAG: hypothetical protein RMJ55_15560 [Roseiflexaceae bacterium]|nr:hypothetical protein [Roseiflexus sp.]MDW8148253.1 hypothetical protein [Roseiflexaceae bacterium]MDW8214973.1 hypothetical protein [Roseiflexaceae bacterium]
MCSYQDQTIITLSREELEALLRRVVREGLTRLLKAQPLSPLDDWGHEGPDDPDGDTALLAEAQDQIERERTAPSPRIDRERARDVLANSHIS